MEKQIGDCCSVSVVIPLFLRSTLCVIYKISVRGKILKYMPSVAPQDQKIVEVLV
jgi:hypothetical protein